MIDVDRVVVLSLARRIDRRAALLLPWQWPWPQPQIRDAVDGHQLELPDGWQRAGHGAYGCAQSHLAALIDAAEDGVESLMVLEDDVIFGSDFAERLAVFSQRVPNDWGMLMLGGQHLIKPAPVTTGVVRCLDTQRTHAYIVRGDALAQLTSLWSRWVGFIDGALPVIQAFVPTYAPYPRWLVGQAAGMSDVTNHHRPTRFWQHRH
jgi:hypothetical protein